MNSQILNQETDKIIYQYYNVINNSYSPTDYYKTLTGETTYYKTLIGIPKYTINDDKIIPTFTKSNTTLIPE